MNGNIRNSGIFFGGKANISGSAIGTGNTVSSGQMAQKPPKADRKKCDLGIMTILPVEMSSVIRAFGLTEQSTAGSRCYVGSVAVPGATVRIAATRALDQGQRPVMSAMESLFSGYRPTMFALVGIGGAIHRKVEVDDVVVANRVIYYDLRRLGPGNTVRRRGRERESPAATTHAINAFFTDNGDPALLRNEAGGSFRVFSGPIGSGEAVVADMQSEIREFLLSYNDKTLAVDMEAGGFSEYCHESSTRPADPPGWVVVRGISDRADRSKDDEYHASAARNAAQVLRALLPYLSSAG